MKSPAGTILFLIVDDDLAVCRILTSMLAKKNYQVRVSQTVSEAVQLIAKELFQVYLIDYRLPDGNGLDIAEKIRATGSQAPILLISGFTQPDVIARAKQLQILEIISKPFSHESISEAILRAVALKETVKQPAQSALPTTPSLKTSTVAVHPRTKTNVPRKTILIAFSSLGALFALVLYLLFYH
jgi:DNA-binding NtrC family response regulator